MLILQINDYMSREECAQGWIACVSSNGNCSHISTLSVKWNVNRHFSFADRVSILSTGMGTELWGSLPNFSPNLSPTLQELTTQKTALLILIYCRCIFLYRVSLWLIIHIKCTCTLLTTLPFLMLTHSLLQPPYNVTFTTRTYFTADDCQYSSLS